MTLFYGALEQYLAARPQAVSISFDIQRGESDNASESRVVAGLPTRASCGESALKSEDVAFMPGRQTSHPPGRSSSDEAPSDGSEGGNVRAIDEGKDQDRGDRRKTHIAALTQAAIHGDREDCLTVLNGLVTGGVSKATIADDYIPHIARQMGDAWCVDEMSFASVTIGVSRLQSLLRDLGPEWRADNAVNPESGVALIVVALDEYHTLGAMVLAGRLRRQGLSVQLQLGLKPADLRRTLAVPKFDAVLISASAGEDLDSLRLLVEAIQTSQRLRQTPIVIGGSSRGRTMPMTSRRGQAPIS